MRRLTTIGISIFVLGMVVITARSALSSTRTAQVVNSIAADPANAGGARKLHTAAMLSMRDMSPTDRRQIKTELLNQYKRIYDESTNKIALDLFGYVMFISEVDRGDAFYAREWLRHTHWDAFNDVLVEVVLAEGISRCDPVAGIRVLISLAWDLDVETRKYARFVLHRAFYDLVHARQEANTLNDDAVDELESLLLKSNGKWTVDPEYPQRWEKAMLEGKAAGSLLRTQSN